MKTYIGTKIIKAEPMTELTFRNKVRNLDIPQEQEDRAGYLVEYSDSYQGWSPKEIFETAYRELNLDELKLLK